MQLRRGKSPRRPWVLLLVLVVAAASGTALLLRDIPAPQQLVVEKLEAGKFLKSGE